MAKLLFVPFSVASGLLAGMLGRKLFAQLWGLVDEEEPPDSSHRVAPWGKVLAAAALEGAVFRATKVATDKGSRTAFYTLTGSWPGDEAPEQE